MTEIFSLIMERYYFDEILKQLFKPQKKQRFLEKYVDFVFEIERTRENRIRKR